MKTSHISAKSQGSSVKTQGVQVCLLSDYWDEDGERWPAGSIVELPAGHARELIKHDRAERADPLPG